MQDMSIVIKFFFSAAFIGFCVLTVALGVGLFAQMFDCMPSIWFDSIVQCVIFMTTLERLALLLFMCLLFVVTAFTTAGWLLRYISKRKGKHEL